MADIEFRHPLQRRDRFRYRKDAKFHANNIATAKTQKLLRLCAL